jgi:hypothetical protein
MGFVPQDDIVHVDLTVRCDLGAQLASVPPVNPSDTKPSLQTPFILFTDTPRCDPQGESSIRSLSQAASGGKHSTTQGPGD